ncbi:PKD-like family lipoprotein [Sphingobacterium corticis]|uniref:PKD-like family lipoprotein n=2 Tax=Sphingobacterium corticis TaxID=1812823 RepID=A0ABW5NHP3_9SPHI
MKICIYICFAAFLLLFGCNKDKPEFNPDLKTVSGFKTTFPLDSTIVIFQLDTVRISPEIEGLEPQKSYSYEWILFSNNMPPEVISTERNLNEPIGAKPDDGYYLSFSVIDDQTGVKHTVRNYVTIQGAFYEGWLVANNVGNQGRLSFIRMDDEVFMTPLEDINHQKYPGKAVAAISAVNTGFGAEESLNQILYFNDAGLTIFNPDDFVQITDLNESFYDRISFTSKPYFDGTPLLTDLHLINGGDLLMAAGPFNPGYTPARKFSDRIEGDYSLFPFSFPGEFITAYYYDNLKKRFLTAAYNTRSVYVANKANGATPGTDGYFNMNNVGKTMIAADYTRGYDYLSLMRDDNGYYIYSFNINTGFRSSFYRSLPQVPEVDDLRGFTASGAFRHAYYASRNKIYRIDASSGAVSLIYEFPSDREISDLKMFKLKNRSYIQLASLQEQHNKLLAIALNNGEKGEVHYIYLNSLGDLDTSRKPKTFTGFGNIVSLDYRNPI